MQNCIKTCPENSLTLSHLLFKWKLEAVRLENNLKGLGRKASFRSLETMKNNLRMPFSSPGGGLHLQALHPHPTPVCQG